MSAYEFRSSKEIAEVLGHYSRHRLHCADSSTFNGPRERFFEYSLGDNQKAQAIRSAKKRYRICCLSKSFDSRLLWAHYASGVDGLAVEVDLLDPSHSNRIYDVTYEERIPNADLHSGDFDTVSLSFLICKDREWCYEDEVRIIQEEVWHQLNAQCIELFIAVASMEDC